MIDADSALKFSSAIVIWSSMSEAKLEVRKMKLEYRIGRFGKVIKAIPGPIFLNGIFMLCLLNTGSKLSW